MVKHYFQHPCYLTSVQNKPWPESGWVFYSAYLGPYQVTLTWWILVCKERERASSWCDFLFFFIFIYHFAGRWRRIKKILPEHVDIFPQGPACLWDSRGVALFQPSPRRLCDARWGLAWNQSLCPLHKQLVRHFPFLYYQQLSNSLSNALTQSGCHSQLKAQHF